VAYDEDLADRIRELIAGEQDVVEKRMFGGLAFLIAGNMSVSVSGQGGLLLRIDPEQTFELLGKPHAHPSVMRGRPMDGWLRVEPDACAPGPSCSAGWRAASATPRRCRPNDPREPAAIPV
jgi:hypothetical protein